MPTDPLTCAHCGTSYRVEADKAVDAPTEAIIHTRVRCPHCARRPAGFWSTAVGFTSFTSAVLLVISLLVVGLSWLAGAAFVLALVSVGTVCGALVALDATMATLIQWQRLPRTIRYSDVRVPLVAHTEGPHRTNEPRTER